MCRNWHFFVYWLGFFPRKPRSAGIRILVVPDVITPALFRGTKHFAPKLLSFGWQTRSRCCCLIIDCNRSRSVIASVVSSFILFFLLRANRNFVISFQSCCSVIDRSLASSRGYKKQRRKVMMMTTTKKNESV